MALREDLEKQGAWLFKWRSYLPLLLVPLLVIALRNSRLVEQLFGDSWGDYWESIAIAVSFLGLLIRCMTAGYVPRGTSGRNTKTQAADVLNTTGMYSITRNPLYLGNFVIVFGITLFLQVWWLALVVWVGFWFYYERIIFTEEEFLRAKFGGRFTEWAKNTPMVIPRPGRWRKSGLPFSFKTVLRREFTTYSAIVAVYFFLELAGNFIVLRRIYVHYSWSLFFFVSMAFYLVFLFLKKKTHLLDVSGR